MSAFSYPLVWMRRLYDWVVGLSERPNGARALFLVAFAESSFFPVPPDVLLLPLAIGSPSRALWFASICSVGSVLGAGVGYLLGLQFYELLGSRIIGFYSAGDQYETVRNLYRNWDAVAVLVAGFTPIPFKLFTIAAGLFRINLLTFLVAAAVGRSARFFLVGGLIWRFGPAMQEFIDRYFNLLSLFFVILLIGGFLAANYVI